MTKVANTRKTEQISLSISKEVLDRLRPVAKADGRSLSNLVQFILKRHVESFEFEDRAFVTISATHDEVQELKAIVDAGKETP